MDETVQKFYNDMTDYYHLIFADWDKSIENQALIIGNILKQNDVTTHDSILDCACGIGTQALGLAKMGYHITGSDISKEAVERAKREANIRNLTIEFLEANFCKLSTALNTKFDVVLAMDNALPHLTEPKMLANAMFSIYSQIEPTGLFIASIRDYDDILKNKPHSSPPYVITTPTGKRVAFQLWEWHEDIYNFTQYIIEDEPDKLNTHKFSCIYRAITRSELTDALISAGFRQVEWIMPDKSGFYQPIVVARKVVR